MPKHHSDCASQAFTGGQGLEFFPCTCGAADVEVDSQDYEMECGCIVRNGESIWRCEEHSR